MKTEYKKAYDSFSISDELHVRLIDIPEKKASACNIVFKAAAALAAVFVLLFSTDMISYAVTGEGVAERVQKTMGEPKKGRIKYVETQGKRIENFTVHDDGTVVTVEFYDPLYGSWFIAADGTQEVIAIGALPLFSVEKKDDRVFATVGDNYFHIDITEDMTDNGNASGEFEADGRTYKYYVFILPEEQRGPTGDDGYRWSIRLKTDHEK